VSKRRRVGEAAGKMIHYTPSQGWPWEVHYTPSQDWPWEVWGPMLFSV
jgi:hypothetical protein